jgi:phosphoglucosamine mutase
VIPTPGVSFLVRGEKAGLPAEASAKAGAGIVISASHNPFQDNGFKPFKSDGTKLSEEEEREIEGYILDETFSRENYNISGKKKVVPDAGEKYVDFNLDKFQALFYKSSTFPSPDITSRDSSKSNFKIVLDCANGATFEVAPAVFEKVAKEINLLYTRPDGRNINYKCGSQHLENLREKVLAEKASLGLAFDGDGDRVIAVDEKGNALTGDQMIYIIAKMLKARGKLKNNLVVTTVMSNLGFVSALKELGISHVATGVGDRQVFFEMKKRCAVLGGEESGHIIYTDFHLTGDGIVGGLMLLAAMDFFGKTLSELAAEISLFPKLLVNVEVKSKPELGGVPEIQSIIKEVEKKLGSEGRVLVRYSGTENLCRVMVEGRDGREINEYANKIADVIKSSLS